MNRNLTENGEYHRSYFTTVYRVLNSYTFGRTDLLSVNKKCVTVRIAVSSD